jgi:hypothetical protein
MATFANGETLEEHINEWRTYLHRQRAIHTPDVVELEAHLRDQVAALVDGGLAGDEAFLVAIMRIGNLDALSREFAREHSVRLWKQLIAAPDAASKPARSASVEIIVMLILAGAAALAIKIPELFGYHLWGDGQELYARNLSLFVLPLLTGYFAWKRGIDKIVCLWLALVFIAAAVFGNVFPFMPGSRTAVLTALHLPIAIWLAVGVAYVGARWRLGNARMDFVRFSGELFIYYVLIALGGGVLTLFTGVMFNAIGLDVRWLAQNWLLPCGAMGAVIVGAWLVEAKQSVIENIAPVLTRLFTPLFTAVLLAFLATMVWTGSGIDLKREVLIGFDFLLVVVLGLLLYAVSARDPLAPPDAFDALQLLLVVSALVVDGVALAAITARITEFGFSANRVAALGENLILFVNLAWSAWLYARFRARRGSFAALEQWQMAYLPVYSVWAALVVVLFPPLFHYA